MVDRPGCASPKGPRRGHVTSRPTSPNGFPKPSRDPDNSMIVMEPALPGVTRQLDTAWSSGRTAGLAGPAEFPTSSFCLPRGDILQSINVAPRTRQRYRPGRPASPDVPTSTSSAPRPAIDPARHPRSRRDRHCRDSLAAPRRHSRQPDPKPVHDTMATLSNFRSRHVPLRKSLRFLRGPRRSPVPAFS